MGKTLAVAAAVRRPAYLLGALRRSNGNVHQHWLGQIAALLSVVQRQRRVDDGGNVSGAKTNTLALSNITAADAGNYKLVVTNSAGSVTSSVANLTVRAAERRLTRKPSYRQIPSLIGALTRPMIRPQAPWSPTILSAASTAATSPRSRWLQWRRRAAPADGFAIFETNILGLLTTGGRTSPG